MTMALSRMQLLRLCLRLGHQTTGSTRRCTSGSGVGEGDKERVVDVTEMSSLKDFVDDAIVRGSSLLLPSPAQDTSQIPDTDCTDIHQRHYVPMTQLKHKELNQALKLFDESRDVDEFVLKYRSTPSLSVAGVIAPPESLYHTVAKVKDLMASGLKPMDALVALSRYSRKALLERVPILQEVVGDTHASKVLRYSQYKAFVKYSVYQARKLKLLPEQKEVIEMLVEKLPLTECIKSKLIERTRIECGVNLNAMSVSEVKIAILNEYLRLSFPRGGFNFVNQNEMGRSARFRLQHAIEIVDIVAQDKGCMENLWRIHFGALAFRFTPTELRKLLTELPTIGKMHVSKVFFMKGYSAIFRHGVDHFIQKYQMLRQEGFSDEEIGSQVHVFRLANDTLRQRLDYWYDAMGKKSVVLSHKGMELIAKHNKAVYNYEVINGKKVVPVHFLLHNRQANARDRIISGYVHEFCNKFQFEPQPFIDRFFTHTSFNPYVFEISNMYNVYGFLQEQQVSREQLMNSPYILSVKLADIEREFQLLKERPEFEDKLLRHPLLLDLIVYRCTAREQEVKDKNASTRAKVLSTVRKIQANEKIIENENKEESPLVIKGSTRSQVVLVREEEFDARSENPDVADDCRKGYAV